MQVAGPSYGSRRVTQRQWNKEDLTTEKLKWIAIAIVALLTVIVVLQNTESVDTKLLFITLSMPRAALLFGTLVIGFVAEMTLGNRLSLRRQKPGSSTNAT